MKGTISRRGFLGAAAASLLSGASPQIIDTHIHLYDPTRAEGVPWPAKTDPLLYKPVLPGAYAAMVRPLGVTGAVVVEASPWVEDNQWVLDLAKENPVIVGLVGHLEAGADGFRRNLARFAKDRLFRGIRLGSAAIVTGITRPAFVDDLRRLADEDLMLDAIGSAAMIPALIALTEKAPKLRIAIDHMPAEPPGWKVEAMRDLAHTPTVYAKVSGVLQRVDGKVPNDVSAYRAVLDQVWEIFGPDRVMYGSNWPVSDRLAPYPTVFKVVKQYADRKGALISEKYFAKNSKACYQWTERS